MNFKIFLFGMPIFFTQIILCNLLPKHIVLVTASYNNKDWYQRNLDAVFAQKYNHYSLEYWNDCSTDGTGELVEQYICARGYKLSDQHEDEKRIYKIYVRPEGAQEVHLVHNKVRCGAMENQYYAIHRQDNTKVCVIYDGDDFFENYDNETNVWKINPYVIKYIAQEYQQNPDIWMTYGQFICWPSRAIGCCKEMPKWVCDQHAFRKHDKTLPSHLRTFYAGLFKKIKQEDLMYQDDFLKMSGDIAAMVPMLEMAADGHFKFISEILLAYNAANPINNFKLTKISRGFTLERYLDLEIRSRVPYKPIDILFEGS